MGLCRLPVDLSLASPGVLWFLLTFIRGRDRTSRNSERSYQYTHTPNVYGGVQLVRQIPTSIYISSHRCLNFSKLHGHVEEKCYPHLYQDITFTKKLIVIFLFK
ncbi:hypothetical protein EJ110_NYTH01194 [Nymphaea thermarum]|nr:hypothetical protein EJ110_NYTH01194 [Nymphaea thermarum]